MVSLGFLSEPATHARRRRIGGIWPLIGRMADEVGQDGQVDALHEEIVRLRAENEELRGSYRVPAQDPADEPAPVRPVRVLLLPDPAGPTEPGRPGPEAWTNVARILVSHLRKGQPDVDWRAEHDLERVPYGAEC